LDVEFFWWPRLNSTSWGQQLTIAAEPVLNLHIQAGPVGVLVSKKGITSSSKIIIKTGFFGRERGLIWPIKRSKEVTSAV
jgi:hypothetical protein